MELAEDKCATLKVRGQESALTPFDHNLQSATEMKDLRIITSKNLSWAAHISNRLKKANKVLYSIRQNVAYNVKTFIKLGLSKFFVLPLLLCGMNCPSASKTILMNLEKLVEGCQVDVKVTGLLQKPT